MSLQENLIEFSPYNIDFKTQNGWFIISLEYNDEWSIIEPENSKIEYLKKDNRHYYGSSIDNSSIIDEVFELIRNTINYNKDIEKKLNLFQDKIKELQEIFAQEEYEDLLTLEFKIKKKRKYIKKKLNDNRNICYNEQLVHEDFQDENINEDSDNIDVFETVTE